MDERTTPATMEGETNENSGKNSENSGKNSENSGENEGKDVYSLAPTGENEGRVLRDGLGRWLPGHAPKPPVPRRKPRQEEQALIAALNEALPAADIPGHIEQCIKWAYEYKSPKLLMQVIEFKYDRLIGTPVQRSVSASGKLENLLSRLSDMDDEEFGVVEQAVRGE